MTIMALSRDINGFVTFGLQPSAIIYGVQLQEGVAQSFTLPTNSPTAGYECIFSIDPGLRVFVAYNGNVAAAYSATIGLVTSELNPTDRVLPGGTQISLITPDAATYVEIAVYAKQ